MRSLPLFPLRLASVPLSPRRSPFVRSWVRLALPLALAATILAAGPVSAFSPTLRTASLDGGTVSASVSGTFRTFVWRMLVERPGATQRLRVFLERGDVAWGGSVSVQERRGGHWVTVERERLDGAGHLRRTICASSIGACVLRGTVRPAIPGGAQRLAVTFQLAGHGTWSVTGSVRQVSEPWIYGPWIADRVEDLRF